MRNGRCEATNLPWVVDSKIVAKQLRLKRVGLINDLVANAYGIGVLQSKDFVILNRGARNAKGNRAIISAGMGLGEAGMYWDGVVHRPFASEGGHADFAPRNHLEMELLDYSLKRYRRVSYERLVSGPGLVNTYQFLRDTGKGEEPSWLAEQLRNGDPAPIHLSARIGWKEPLVSPGSRDLRVSLRRRSGKPGPQAHGDWRRVPGRRHCPDCETHDKPTTDEPEDIRSNVLLPQRRLQKERPQRSAWCGGQNGLPDFHSQK
ncbi:MAG: glucokinase [Syntrophobacteraceae bacterium]